MTGDGLQERGSSRVVVERYDRLELRTKDSNVTVVELRLINYGGGRKSQGLSERLRAIAKITVTQTKVNESEIHRIRHFV